MIWKASPETSATTALSSLRTKNAATGLCCELDAIYAHMCRLERSDQEWILDASPPISSFPTIKKNEMKTFGEYRTQGHVLQAFDALQRGEVANHVHNAI